MAKYIALDIGCIECGEQSHVLGIFNDPVDAGLACVKAEKLQAKNWMGEHEFYVEEIEDEDTEYIPSYGVKVVEEERLADNEISGTENANGVPQLKPCPFCGGEAKVNTLPWVNGYTATALCKNEPNAHYLNTWDKDEAKAVERIIDAWNTRFERTCRIVERHGDWYCDVCGEMVGTCDPASELCIDGNAIELWNYCPNCGARVIGGAE